MSVYKIFNLLVFNRECMGRNVMTSFRLLSSFECFYVISKKTISFFTLQCELFTSCKVSNNASLVSARSGGGSMEGGRGGAQPNVNRPGQGEWGSQKLPNLCGHPLWMTPINGLFKRYISKQ